MQDLVAVHKTFYANLVRYWPLIIDLAKRDLRARYRGSYLGFLWSFLNPLLLMLTYTLIFSYVARFDIPNYALYVLIGVLMWQFMSVTISEAAYSIQSAFGLVTKTPLPAEIIPIKTAIAQALNFCLSFTVYLAVAIIVFHKFTIFWSFFPLVFILLFLFGLFVAVPIAMLSVMYKDLQQLIVNVLALIFFTTPVIYDFNMLPEKIQKLMILNPFAQLVIAGQEFLFYGRFPAPWVLISIVVYILIFQVIAVFVAARLRDHVAEKI